MATSGEKRWPPVGNFVAASGEKPMAIDTQCASFARVARRQQNVATPAADCEQLRPGAFPRSYMPRHVLLE